MEPIRAVMSCGHVNIILNLLTFASISPINGKEIVTNPIHRNKNFKIAATISTLAEINTSLKL